MTEGPKKAVLYARVSTAEQAERGYSLAQQIEACRTWCEREGYEVLEDVLRPAFDYVVVDRTAFLRSGRDRLTLEHVPDWIYPAVYPSWFLSEARFLAVFARQYTLLSSFPALDTNQPDGEEGYYKGFIFKLSSDA